MRSTRRFVRLALPLAAIAAALTAFVGSSSPASAGCQFTAWGVTAETLTMRDAPGGTPFTTMHGGDAITGPVGQGGATWVYGSGLHRHGNPWTTTGRAGYVLHQYLDYEGTYAC